MSEWKFWECPECGRYYSQETVCRYCPTPAQAPKSSALSVSSIPLGTEIAKKPKNAPKQVSVKTIGTEPNQPHQRGKKVLFDSYTFDSNPEYERYVYLKSLLEQRIIHSLFVHPKWSLLPRVVLEPNALRVKITQRAITYSADFEYFYQGLHVVEDVKGAYGNSKNNQKKKRVGKPIISDVSRLRHKMLQAKYPSMVFLIITNPNLDIQIAGSKAA